MDEERFVRFEMDAHDLMMWCRKDPAACADYRTHLLTAGAWIHAALDALREYQERNRRAA